MKKMHEVKYMRKNKALYTATSVVYGWAGAVIVLCKPKNSKIDDTDRWMDGLMDWYTILKSCVYGTKDEFIENFYACVSDLEIGWGAHLNNLILRRSLGE